LTRELINECFKKMKKKKRKRRKRDGSEDD
jgi:hypothetical protein